MNNKPVFILTFLTFSYLFVSRMDVSYKLLQIFGILYAISWVVLIYFYWKANKKNTQKT